MWTPEIKNGDLSGGILQHSEALIQWLKEALLNENNAIYARIGSAGPEEVEAAMQSVIMERMEALLGAYKQSPGLFFPDQIFINFNIVPSSPSSFLITLTLLSGETTSLTVEAPNGSAAQL